MHQVPKAELLPLRILIAFAGVFLSIFFQAWGLPIFLCLAVLVGRLVNSKFSQFRANQNVGPYYKSLIVLFFLFFPLQFLFGLNKNLTSQILSNWDAFSIISVTVTEVRVDRVLNKTSIKLLMNLTSLIIPLIVAKYYLDIIGSYKFKKFLTRSIPVSYVILLIAFFIFCTTFPFWILKLDYSGGFNTLGLIYLIYLLQCLVLMLFHE